MLHGGFVRSGLAVCMVLGLLGVTAAADWPQFLGPDRSGVSRELQSLAGGSFKPMWQVPVGVGFGGAAIYGDSVLILDREAGRGDVLRRLQLPNGAEVWRYAYEAAGNINYPGSRSTPATDGSMVYSVGPMGHVKAVRFSDGGLVWEAHLLRDWGSKRPDWAVAQSPLLLGDSVIVAPWGTKASVVAYSKADGSVLWTTPNPDGVGMDYQSVVPMMLDGRQTVVASGLHGYTIGVDARTGQGLWRFTGYDCKWHIPSPTVVDGSRVLLVGGYRAGAVMFAVAASGGAYRTDVVWQSNKTGSHTGQALLYNGHIYVNSQDTGGGLQCLSLDGQVVWDSARSRRKFERGNLIIAGGYIFIVDGRNGELVVADASPAGYNERASTRVLGGKQVWAPLAYSNGMLVVRDQSKLVCLSLTGQ